MDRHPRLWAFITEGQSGGKEREKDAIGKGVGGKTSMIEREEPGYGYGNGNGREVALDVALETGEVMRVRSKEE
jgi:hypothetical protein